MKVTSIIIQKRNGSKVDYAEEWSQGSGKVLLFMLCLLSILLSFSPQHLCSNLVMIFQCVKILGQPLKERIGSITSKNPIWKKMSQRNSINAIIYSRIGEGDKEQRRIVNRKLKV